jgi:HrpA-like RNA helicase
VKRDFGPINYNQTPPGGNTQPHFISERGNAPQAFHRNFYTTRQPNPVLARLIAAHEVQYDEQVNESVDIGNPELPIYAFQKEIVETIEKSPVTIIVGETGSGKSTQIPQFLLQAGYDQVSLTQPRRLATYSIAERIGLELKGSLGEDKSRDIVGYQTAEKSTVTPDTKITVLTDGIEAVRRFYDKPSTMQTVHVLDEVHEWNTNLELAVALIKLKLEDNPKAKFVLTSATMDAYKLANYFAEATGKPAPVIEVPGRTFPIEHVIEPTSNIVDETIKQAVADPTKDILVFVPGKREIQDTIDKIRAKLPRDIAATATILPLHAKLSQQEQARINEKYPGIKIIVSTNVAQTSLTVDGIDVVVDCALERRIELDEEGVEGLKIAPIAQADCDQRKGRTGRTGPGKYIFTRYDKDAPFLAYEERPKFAQPEILRTDIVRSVLRAEAAGLDLEHIDLFHPVKFRSIREAKKSLKKLGALDENEEITALGYKMNEIPVKPSSARMIVEAERFSSVVRSYVAAIAASIEVGGLPYFAHDSGRAWQKLVEETKSDHLAQLELFIAAQNLSDKQLSYYDFDFKNIKRAQELHRKIVFRSDAYIGTLPSPSIKEKEQIKEAVIAGLVDWVYVHVGKGKYTLVGSEGDVDDREISDRSVIKRAHPKHVVATPYRVEFFKDGKPDSRPIIESITAIEDIRILGRIATRGLIEKVPERVEMAAGKLIQVSQAMFQGQVALGQEYREQASYNEESRTFMREHVLSAPGPAQRALRKIKRDLENLQHYTHRPLNLFTQEKFELLVDRVLDEGILDETYIDERLRQITVEENITINTFVRQQRINAIMKRSPDTISVNGLEFGLKYARGNPRIIHFDPSIIHDMPKYVRLKDNRDVYFFHEKRWHTIAELKKILPRASK